MHGRTKITRKSNDVWVPCFEKVEASQVAQLIESAMNAISMSTGRCLLVFLSSGGRRSLAAERRPFLWRQEEFRPEHNEHSIFSASLHLLAQQKQ